MKFEFFTSQQTHLLRQYHFLSERIFMHEQGWSGKTFSPIFAENYLYLAAIKDGHVIGGIRSLISDPLPYFDLFDAHYSLAKNMIPNLRVATLSGFAIEESFRGTRIENVSLSTLLVDKMKEHLFLQGFQLITLITGTQEAAKILHKSGFRMLDQAFNFGPPIGQGIIMAASAHSGLTDYFNFCELTALDERDARAYFQSQLMTAQELSIASRQLDTAL